MLKVGDTAPDFEAINCRGETVHLTDFRGQRTVLFFFPRAFTLGCTIENRAFRDNHQLIKSLGADLIGVSVDSVERQCEFAAREEIHFTLLGDPDKKLGHLYGVLWPGLEVDRRVTFIISPEGRVEHVIHHEVRVWRHLDDVLEYLRSHPLNAASV